MKQRRLKTLQSGVLAGVMGFCLLARPGIAMADAWERTDGAYRTTDGTPIPGVLSRGIDTSYWNQNIDWNQVKNDDVDFVMLATRFRGQPDPYFLINAENAHAAGLKVGAYLYSYATSVEMAEQEADFVLNLIKDFPISYPVAFDAEDAGTLGTLPPAQVSEVINAFCKKIEDAGYYPMVYANEYWLENKIDLSSIHYDIWVARYNTMYTYDRPTMWQATNTGSVNGVNGNVDIDFLFTDYSSIIPADTWRTIAGNTYYYKDYRMQKSDWIHDGSGWFYMGDQGTAMKGWMSMPEGWYYLDEPDGRMATGWRDLGGSWYYLKESGRMATGWRQIESAWYYLDADGRMQTGWQDIGGARYYLNSSGVMATGWQNQDGAWYYLDGSGAMTTGWQNVGGAWYYLDSSGVMQTGWQNVDGTWYYLDGSGAMLTGWLEIGGALYYLDNSGALAVNTVLDYNGVKYQSDGNGVCTPVLEEGVTMIPQGGF